MFIIEMQPPNGAPVEYWPEGFGFTSHAHTLDRDQAARFDSEPAAWQRANGYRWPPAFWESERKHRDRMEAKFRLWQFRVVAA
jgi:hypothetical protein